MEKQVLVALKYFTAEEIKRAIERYSIVRQNIQGKYRDLYQWTLSEFLTRDSRKNLVRFNSEDWERPFLTLGFTSKEEKHTSMDMLTFGDEPDAVQP